MKVLFFDTTCDFILVGIYDFHENTVKEDYFYSGIHPREASYRLLGDIETGLQSINLLKPDAIACCIGPGSFTGIRISVTTARNLSQIWNIPVVGFDSVEMYSIFYSEYFQKPVITAIDGKQKKVFTGFADRTFYKGTYDIKPAEISTVFETEIGTKPITIVSDANFDFSDYNLYENLPNPMHLFKKKIEIFQKISLYTYSYSSLLPKYMRETYAHKG